MLYEVITKIIGVDISPSLVEYGNSKIYEQNLQKKVQLIEGA